MTIRTRAALLAGLTLAALALAPAGALAAPEITRAPLDPTYKAQVEAGGPVTHSPIMVQSGAEAQLPLRVADLPSAYSLVDLGLLTEVRDQGAYNTCWAFSSMAALESRLLPGEIWDFSEDNLVLRSGFGPFPVSLYQAGGNYLMSSAYFARWAGPLTENADQYHTPTTKPVSPVAKHVQGMLLLEKRGGDLDNSALKSAVATYGAVATQMRYVEKSAYFNDTTSSYHYTGPVDTTHRANHGVAIVGWDDAYSKANFATQPASDGAFLVRNSWGDKWGVDGYFWISYYDKVLARTDMSLAMTRVDERGIYTRVYGWDKLGWATSIGLTGTADPGVAKFASRFTAKAAEKIAAVSFYTIAPNAAYTVYAGSTLTSMTVRGSGTVAEAGYSTVPMNRMSVRKGSRFVVAVRLDIPGTRHPVPLEAPYKYASSTASAGQSYLRMGSRWVDVTNLSGLREANVCLKAFAQN